ncbi:hypothetical protein ElyMa_001030200 [Elysia marginata]|uniref:Uncharacterized protein n=1 Tax=Elysia marginata TaxID=1093978 RepID=A0AAV4HN43_9GAST|nr:hypothetical protein ElyMa_001030200 [Elysia marginata]
MLSAGYEGVMCLKEIPYEPLTTMIMRHLLTGLIALLGGGFLLWGLFAMVKTRKEAKFPEVGAEGEQDAEMNLSQAPSYVMSTGDGDDVVDDGLYSNDATPSQSDASLAQVYYDIDTDFEEDWPSD